MDSITVSSRSKGILEIEFLILYWGAPPVSDTPLSGTKFGKRFVIWSFGGLDPRKQNFFDFRRSDSGSSKNSYFPSNFRIFY